MVNIDNKKLLKILRLTSLIPLFISIAYNSYAQNTIFDKKISITSNNEKLSTVLNKISFTSEINFSYNSNILPVNKIISVKASNKTLKEVLDDVFKDYNVDYKLMEKQIIIFPKPGMPLEKAPAPKIEPVIQKKTEEKPVPKPEIKQNINREVTKTKNVIIYDTITKVNNITHYDTLVYYDTITHHDTIKSNMKSIINDTINSKWSLDLFFTPQSSTNFISANANDSNNFSDTIKSIISPNFTYSFGAHINYNIKNFFIQSGILYTQFVETLNYNYNQTYSYYDIDTLDSYYTIAGIDTNWYYVKDSVKMEKTNSKLYESINKTTYIEIPLSLGYNIKGNFISFYLKGSIITGFLINVNGKIISQNNNKLVDIDSNNPKFVKPNFAFAGSIGIKCKLDNSSSLIIEPCYRKSLNSIYNKSYPISKKTQSIGLTVGLRYKF